VSPEEAGDQNDRRPLTDLDVVNRILCGEGELVRAVFGLRAAVVGAGDAEKNGQRQKKGTGDSFNNHNIIIQ
jgi:hypothetical protein